MGLEVKNPDQHMMASDDINTLRGTCTWLTAVTMPIAALICGIIGIQELVRHHWILGSAFTGAAVVCIVLSILICHWVHAYDKRASHRPAVGVPVATPVNACQIKVVP